MQFVDPKGPAGKAGLLGTRRSLAGVVAGDAIVNVNGRRVQSPADVEASLDSAAVGDSLTVKLRRSSNGVCVLPCMRMPVPPCTCL
jgi:S1-C subfamily serine protease